MTGVQGIGAADNFGSFFDVMQGSIFGFASYDSALTATEVSQHYNAFVIPEPGSAALGLLALAGLAIRRRAVR